MVKFSHCLLIEFCVILLNACHCFLCYLPYSPCVPGTKGGWSPSCPVFIPQVTSPVMSLAMSLGESKCEGVRDKFGLNKLFV